MPPWQNYAPQSPAPAAGPWATYGAAPAPTPPAAPAPAQPPSTLEDMARSAWGGLVGGAASLANSLDLPTVVTNSVKDALAKTRPDLAASIVPRASQTPGIDYQPKTTSGRYTHAVASMAPNAFLGPEGLIPKVAATVLPGVTQQGASDLTKAMGGDQNAQAVAGFVGGLAGGGAAGFTGAARRAPQILSEEEKPVANALQAALDVTGHHRDDVKAITSTGVLPAAATPGLTQLADAVTTQPGTGQTLIRDAVGQRFASQSQRALQAVQSHLNVDPAAAHGDVDSIVKQGQQTVRPLYDALTANPAPVMTPRLAVLAQTPAVKKAIGLTVSDMLNDPDGPSPTTAGFKLNPDTGGWEMPQYGIGGVVEQQPTAATWIKVHQNLGQSVDRNPITNAVIPDSVSPGNRNIGVVGGKLGDELKTAIPGYDQALAQSGDYLSTRGAFNRASGMLFSKPVYDFQQMWSSLKNPSEVKAAQAALANDILTKSEGASILPGAFKNPGVQQKMAIAFPGKSDAFLQQMEDDMAERRALGGVIGGSQTASRQALASQLATNTAKRVGPVRKAAQALTTGIDNVASFTHPLTAVTRVAKMVAGSNTPKDVPPVWENPQTNAALGALLADPKKMTPFLDRMAAQRAADYQASRSGGLLSAPRLALPGLLSGLAAPSASAAIPGQPSP